MLFGWDVQEEELQGTLIEKLETNRVCEEVRRRPSHHPENHKADATQPHSHPQPGSSFMADIKIDYFPQF